MGEATRQKGDRKALWIILPALMLMIFLVQPREAQAQWSTNGNNINNTNAGNVGVGTTNPTSALQVTGSTPGVAPIRVQHTATTEGWSGIEYLNGAGTVTAYSGANNATGEFRINNIATGAYLDFMLGQVSKMRIANTGFVGIGTTTPGTKLDIGAGSAPRGNYSDVLIGSGGDNAQLELFGPTKSAAFTNDESLSGLLLYTNGPAWNPSFFVGNSGNVGVGTTTPTAKLDVNGNINVTGNINAKYQDVAEWVPASKMMPAGTVVVLDPEKNNQVMSSSQPYDTRVAGVISERPGLALGESGAGKVLVATTGRVKVRVEATRAPIHVGDLLVTGDKEGVAMKSEPMMIQGRAFHSPGTLIGKALEPLEKGKTGEILVLLSLQ
jgi:hypothetical protein